MITRPNQIGIVIMNLSRFRSGETVRVRVLAETELIFSDVER